MGIKNLFIKEEELKPSNKGSIISKPIKYVPAKQEETVDLEMKEFLLGSLQENRLAGFDYLKFQSALVEATELTDTEPKQYKVAALSAKQLGFDKAKLVSSAQHYLQVLEEDSKEFTRDLSKKQRETVGKTEEELVTLEKIIEDSQKQIELLTNEIQEAKLKHSELTNTVTTTKQTLEEKKQLFTSTYNTLVTEIKTNIDKINQYL